MVSRWFRKGHEMFLPFLKYSKVKFGFTAISDVRTRNPPKRDAQAPYVSRPRKACEALEIGGLHLEIHSKSMVFQ